MNFFFRSNPNVLKVFLSDIILINCLGLDGQQIIIFGGRNEKGSNFTPEESLYTLNINTFKWEVPKVSGNSPKSRHYHKANVIGKHMVISFGNYYYKYHLITNLIINFNQIIIIKT